MLSCAGDPNAVTPHLDRLAAEGVRFTRAHSVFPLCCPARGTLLTGRYPHDCVNGHEVRLPPEMPTIAHAFGDAGRHTAWFGKWHLDGFHERDGRAAFHHVPRERRGGFDTWIGYENNNAQFDCHVHGHRRTADETEEVEQYRLPSFETDDLTDLAIGHLETLAAEGEPFFRGPLGSAAARPVHRAGRVDAPAPAGRRGSPAERAPDPADRGAGPPRDRRRVRPHREPRPQRRPRPRRVAPAAASPTTPPSSTSPTTATSTVPTGTSASARRTRAA